jgi:hypothetical protein
VAGDHNVDRSIAIAIAIAIAGKPAPTGLG